MAYVKKKNKVGILERFQAGKHLEIWVELSCGEPWKYVSFMSLKIRTLCLFLSVAVHLYILNNASGLDRTFALHLTYPGSIPQHPYVAMFQCQKWFLRAKQGIIPEFCWLGPPNKISKNYSNMRNLSLDILTYNLSIKIRMINWFWWEIIL